MRSCSDQKGIIGVFVVYLFCIRQFERIQIEAINKIL